MLAIDIQLIRIFHHLVSRHELLRRRAACELSDIEGLSAYTCMPRQRAGLRELCQSVRPGQTDGDSLQQRAAMSADNHSECSRPSTGQLNQR